jgi:hypothetical protein
MYRQNTYNEGYTYTLIPVHRQQVVPGQSVELTINSAFESPPFLGNLMSGGVASLYAFYVPHRLVWDQWVDFISDPQTGVTVPVNTVAWDFMFERLNPPNRAPTVLFRRGYKLVYNEFFGNADFGNFYGNVFNDAETSVKGLRTNDQFLGKVQGVATMPEQTYDADVTGTAPDMVATIELNELRKLLKLAKSARRSDQTGDKYVDAMRRLGVDLDWRVQMAPEFLGASHKEFQPKDTRATFSPSLPAVDAANTGQSFSRYQENLHLHVGRKFFAEHGYVMVVAAVRPFAFNDGFKYPADGYVNEYQEFFLKDNQEGVDGFEQNQFMSGPAAANRLYTNRFQYLQSGHNMIGLRSTVPFVPTDVSTDLPSAVYPSPLDIAQTEQLQNQLALFTRVQSGGPSPVRKGVI